MTKTVPFEILCKSILFIDFCTVLHIEEKKIDCNFFPLLHKCKFYHHAPSQFKGNDTID